MDNALPRDVLAVRTPAVNFHVLRDAAGLYLLDAGFIGGRQSLRRALQRRGWEREPIRGIIVTHGHLDHILNVARLARETGAWIAAPRLDKNHFAGHPEYRGWARVTGGLEAMGRIILPFEPSRRIDGSMMAIRSTFGRDSGPFISRAIRLATWDSTARNFDSYSRPTFSRAIAVCAIFLRPSSIPCPSR